MLEGLRQILGDSAFRALQQGPGRASHRYANADAPRGLLRAGPGRIAREKVGFEASNMGKLDQYLQQWIYGTDEAHADPHNVLREHLRPRRLRRRLRRADAPRSRWAVRLGFGEFTPGAARDYALPARAPT